MNKPTVLSTVVVRATAALVLLASPAATAQAEQTGRDFGHHVAGCAQTLGMSGSHNPGMHQGLSDWDGMPC
ncbi:hypothetical protein GCM10009841_19850 [Microlunatus panaciterrae]|uniref:Excalibur calcium-binding domain-containing protein n=1 Tax=Microlunatus panaciterrae TaxID=400768 RepID=A0ABS2RRG5_9ACTN|nr:hypothetical protein [Microlunatus panaciterrae]MBM7800539.1 hypothetical protein [Microlunatus panaciterrae]